MGIAGVLPSLEAVCLARLVHRRALLWVVILRASVRSRGTFDLFLSPKLSQGCFRGELR